MNGCSLAIRKMHPKIIMRYNIYLSEWIKLEKRKYSCWGECRETK